MARTRAEEAQQTRAAAAARHGEAEEATQKLRAQIQASKVRRVQGLGFHGSSQGPPRAGLRCQLL